MSEKIGVGLASFGMSGLVFHGPLLHVHPGFELVSILERSKNLSAERYPQAKIVRDYEELIRDNSIDLVVVNTPDPLHFEMAKQALHAGKHVIVEKPFVLNSDEGQELIELAARRNRLLSVFQNRRWDGDFLTVRKILDEGVLGRLVEYEAHFDRYRNFIQENTWKEDAGYGSTLNNLGSHLIDQALCLFGKPENVFADVRTLRTGGRVDDAFTILLAYPEVKVTLKASYLVREPGPRYYLHGTEGSYLKHGIDPQEDALKRGELPGGDEWGKEPESEWGLLNTGSGGSESRGKIETLPGRYQDFYENIYHALESGTEPTVTAEQANLVIRVIEAARESQESGRRVPV
jgi:predicted dehydrogenase